MQNNKALNLRLNAGAPASAVPRTWFLFVNNVLKYLTIRNGRLLVNDDKWTIECGQGTASNVWSGYYWYGGEVYGPITDITGQYFGINLRTGQLAGTDGFADATSDTEEVEWRYVADKTVINEGEEDEEVVYTLSNRTVGDIVFRIT